jgi:hypothetical protein
MSDQTPAGSARIMKTKRVQHVVTSDEAAAFRLELDAVWDTPFSDLNYTCDQNIEAVSPADPTLYFVNGFSKTVDKITVVCGCAGAAGDVVILHAHAIRD